jgi:hypothetical protein
MEIETKTKRRIYILVSIILGILLAVITDAFIEKAYINNILAKGMVPVSTWSHNCFLPLFMTVAFLAAGVIFGYILGVRWWQLVYVEKRHWRRRRK